MMLQTRIQAVGFRGGVPSFRPPTTVRHVTRAAETSEAVTEPPSAPSAPSPKKALWVGNLPLSSKIREVKELFNNYGAGTVVYLREKETRRFKGMAFVEVDPDKAEQAIADLNEKDFKGRTIRVNLSNLPEDTVLRPSKRPPRRKGAGKAKPSAEGASAEAPAAAPEPAAAAASQ